MTGRAATRILNGMQGRAIVRALAAVVVEPAIASGQVACGGCGAALRFEPDPMSGHVFECCDPCRTRRRIERRAPVDVMPDARSQGLPVRHCARCGHPLEVLVRGRGGGRPARMCKDRRACARREHGTPETPATRRTESVRRLVMAVVPDDRARALDSTALHALLPQGTEISTVRVALYELWCAQLVTRDRRGLSYFYWRTT